MTSADQRLIALAAVFLPRRTELLFARIASTEAASLGQAAARAAAAPRRDRLGALASLLDARGVVTLTAEDARAVQGTERSRTTAALLALTSSYLSGAPPDGLRPALRRLLLERLVSAPPAETRSCVREPNTSTVERAGGPVPCGRHDP